MLRCSEVQILEWTRVMVGMGKCPMWQSLRVLLIVCVDCRFSGKQSYDAKEAFST